MNHKKIILISAGIIIIVGISVFVAQKKNVSTIPPTTQTQHSPLHEILPPPIFLIKEEKPNMRMQEGKQEVFTSSEAFYKAHPEFNGRFVPPFTMKNL